METRVVSAFPAGRRVVRCRPQREPYFARHARPSRRRELDEFACEAGLSKADLVRLGLKWLLQNRDVLLKLPAAPGDGRVSSP